MEGLWFEAAAALGVAGSLGGIAAFRGAPVLDRAPPRAARPIPAHGMLLAGTTRMGRPVRISPERLVSGLGIEGTDAGRRAMFSSLMVQASARGLGYLMLSCGADDAYADAARSQGVCIPSRLTVIDTLAGPEGTHSLSFLCDLPGDAIVRIVLASCPRFHAGGPVPARATVLLEALVNALVNLRDARLCDLTTDALLDHLDFRHVFALGDPDAYPSLPRDLREAVETYLESLPGYTRARLYKQPPATLDAHADVAAVFEEGLGWLRGRQYAACLAGYPDLSVSDLCAPGRQVVIRAIHGPGERHALPFLVACLSEALRGRTRDAGGGMPFLVMVDGLDAMPSEVSKAVAAFGSVGLAVGARTSRAARSEGVEHVLARCETLIGLDPVATRPALLSTHARKVRFRPLSWRPPLALDPIEKRVVLSRPSRQDINDAARLPLVLSCLIDPDLPEELELRDGENKATLRLRADAGDPIALAALYLSNRPDQMRQDTGTAIGVLALKASGHGEGNRSSSAPPPPPPPAPVAQAPTPPEEDLDLDFGSFDFDPLAGLGDVPDPKPAPPPGEASTQSVIVVPANLSEDPFLKDKAWKAMVGRPLPLGSLDQSDAAREILVGEFPHLERQVDRILSDASSRNAIRLRPVLFHGAPGAGKTRFARRVGEVLGLGALIYNCGGSSDASFGGTSRQWTSGRPSVPMQTIRRLMLANPCIILDEIEKVGDGRQNGNLADLLLGLTERETSGRSFDLYLEAEVDLSHVVWFAVANGLSGLHPALVERFRLVEIPLPGLEHADSHVRSMVRSVNEDRGILPVWAFDPSEAEVEMMAETWGGGSFRRLRSVVERTIDSLDAIDPSRLH